MKKICSAFKLFLEKFDEIFSLEMIVFIFLIFDYIKCILSCVKNFNDFTDFQWFAVVSLISLVFYGIWSLCTMLEIKRLITHKDDDKR